MYMTNEAPGLGALKICVYGESGVGKTKLISTLPEHWRILFIDLERKTGVLAKAKQAITRLQFSSYKDLVESLPKIVELSRDYDAIVVDSLSDMRNWLYNSAKKTLSQGKEVILDKHELQIWGFAANKIGDFIDELKMVDKPIIFLARQTIDANLRSVVDLGNKLVNDIPAKLDTVFPLVKNGQGKRAIIINNDKFFTRLHDEEDFMERFPEGIAPANLSEIFNLV